MKFKSIIGISGRICSGKSYAAELIASEFSVPVASFGGYLKYYCEKEGLPTDRKSLQYVGQNLVDTNPIQFVISVINHFIGSKNLIVIEGIRHRSIFEIINTLSENTLSIFVHADQETRYERYTQREKDSDQMKTHSQFIEADNHPVELEIESLKPLCDIVVDSTEDYSIELNNFLLTNLIKLSKV